MKLESNRVSLDQLTKWCKVESLDDFHDGLGFDGTYSFVYKQALEEGKTDVEAERMAMEAESEEMGEASRKYHSAIVSACEKVFADHHLTMTPVVSRKYPDCLPFEFRLAPTTTWFEALSEIRMTINGYGMFEFRSNKELCESIQCTVRTAVLQHLHWCFTAWKIYGDYSPQYRIEKDMR